MKFRNMLLIACFWGFACLAYAQKEGEAVELDFAKFVATFPKASLPYNFAVNPKAKFKKNRQLSKHEAEAFFTGFQNTDGANVMHFDALIEPFPFGKNEEGREFGAIATGQKIACLQKTEAYTLLLARVDFEQRGYDNLKGEQYLLYSYTSTGQPLTVLPVAQHMQFDLHSNQVKGTIDTKGNIKLQVEIYTAQGTEKKEENYQVKPNGKIVEIK